MREPGTLPRGAILTESGLDLLRGIVDGRHPPPAYALTTDCLLTEIEDGRVVFEGRPSAAFLNPLGTVHGGWTAGILDSAMACAVHSILKAGQAYTTLEMKVHLVRSVPAGAGRLLCEGRVVHRGGTVATSEGFLRDEAGRLYAHGTETCLVFDALFQRERNRTLSR